jgi:TolA-binding protein
MLIDRGDEAQLAALVPIAIHTYRTVLQRFGTELPAFVAARSMSECMGLAGDWRRGVAVLDSIADTFGNDPRAGSLLVQAARLAVAELDDRGRAGTLLAELYSRYPDSDVAVLARGLEDSLGLRVRTP